VDESPQCGLEGPSFDSLRTLPVGKCSRGRIITCDLSDQKGGDHVLHDTSKMANASNGKRNSDVCAWRPEHKGRIEGRRGLGSSEKEARRADARNGRQNVRAVANVQKKRLFVKIARNQIWELRQSTGEKKKRRARDPQIGMHLKRTQVGQGASVSQSRGRG